MTLLTVRQIIQKAGGPKALHAQGKLLARERQERPIAEKTIYSWFVNGIPEKHWWLVMPVCKVTVSELHKANEELRRKNSACAA